MIFAPYVAAYLIIGFLTGCYEEKKQKTAEDGLVLMFTFFWLPLWLICAVMLSLLVITYPLCRLRVKIRGFE